VSLSKIWFYFLKFYSSTQNRQPTNPRISRQQIFILLLYFCSYLIFRPTTAQDSSYNGLPVRWTLQDCRLIAGICILLKHQTEHCFVLRPAFDRLLKGLYPSNQVAHLVERKLYWRTRILLVN